MEQDGIDTLLSLLTANLLKYYDLQEDCMFYRNEISQISA